MTRLRSVDLPSHLQGRRRSGLIKILPQDGRLDHNSSRSNGEKALGISPASATFTGDEPRRAVRISFFFRVFRSSLRHALLHLSCNH